MIDFLGGRAIVEKNSIIVSDKSDLLTVLSLLKNSSLFDYKMLVDIVGVDEGSDISLRYVLLSLRTSSRIVVVCQVGQEVPSIISLFKSADWLEREVYDMFGVQFKGHPDMRRILTDYGFKGHPLLKSFATPTDVRYSDESKSVVNVDLSPSTES